MKNMKDNILNYSDFATDFTCATNVARVLRESGGIFSDIDDGFFTPWGLKGALFEIQIKKELCLMPMFPYRNNNHCSALISYISLCLGGIFIILKLCISYSL